MRIVYVLVFVFLSFTGLCALDNETVVDIPTREGVTQRMLVLAPPHPKAVILSYAGGHGGLQLSKEGAITWGAGNFLVRSRQKFANHGFIVLTLDAPSDKLYEPYLMSFRQTKEHAQDAKAIIAWARETYHLPVWMMGTSRGTQSVAYIATQLSKEEGADGIVLTSTILDDRKNDAVPEMKLSKISIPVLVAHHEEDGCSHCRYSQIPELMRQLEKNQQKELLTFTGGQTKGDPCLAYGYHGFNGIEAEVVQKIADWVKAH